jgi:hypothetical protein
VSEFDHGDAGQWLLDAGHRPLQQARGFDHTLRNSKPIMIFLFAPMNRFIVQRPATAPALPYFLEQ